MPSRTLLFPYCLACVHQEDRSYLFFLQVYAQSTAAVPAPPCYPSAHPRMCYPSAHPRTCYPSAHPRTYYPIAHPRTCNPSAHSERAIQVHAQNVLSKCTLRTCYPSAHPRMCYPSAHSERAIQVHGILKYYSCTTYLVHLSYLCTSRASLVLRHPSRAPLLSCTKLVHHSYPCTHLVHPTHASIVLVHLYSHASPISCTTRAPLRTLMHPSRAPLVLVHQSRAPLILVYHSAISCTTA